MGDLCVTCCCDRFAGEKIDCGKGGYGVDAEDVVGGKSK